MSNQSDSLFRLSTEDALGSFPFATNGLGGPGSSFFFAFFFGVDDD